MDRLRLSSRLVRIARMLIVANIAGDFRTAMLKADPSIDAGTLDEMSEFVKSCSSKPKIQRLASYCLVRGFLKWSEGKQDFDTVVRLFELVNDLNQGMIQSQSDYDKLAHPEKYRHDDDCKRYVSLLYGQEARQERATGGFNPDTEFKGKRYADGVVTIYRLKESKKEMQKVRRALDVCVSVTANPWCLAARADDDDPCFEPGSDNFERAWKMWKYYRKSPKRIAFKGGKPVAFYADEQWWDMNDKPHDELPVQGAADDPEFLEEIEASWDIVKKAEKGHLTDEEIIALANGDDEEVRKALVKRKGLPEEVIRKLAEDENDEVRKALVKRKDLPEEVIRKLAEDENDEVRKALAEGKYLPEEVIRKLAEDENDDVKWKIAKNIFLPDDVVCLLAKDSCFFVKECISNRINLPEDAIRMLAEDKYVRVRQNISWKNDLPDDVVLTLAKDDDSEVRGAIARRDDLPEDLVRQLLDDESLLVREVVMRRKDLPEDLIRQMAVSDDKWNRYHIAKRDNLPEDVVRLLANDRDPSVRSLAKKHCS